MSDAPMEMVTQFEPPHCWHCDEPLEGWCPSCNTTYTFKVQAPPEADRPPHIYEEGSGDGEMVAKAGLAIEKAINATQKDRINELEAEVARLDLLVSEWESGQRTKRHE